MNIIDACGLLGSIFIVLMFIPEIHHVYKYKDAKAISYSFLHLNLLASGFSLMFSLYYKVIPMLITNIAAGLFSMVMYYFKYIYELKDNSLHEDISAPIV
jgi:uncharacterized protein with PQ loop repeat